MGSKASRGIVAFAEIVVTIFYLLVSAYFTATIVSWLQPLGLQPMALFGGLGLFTVIFGLDLLAVLVLERITPFIVIFLLPAIIGYIAVKQAADSAMIHDFIKRVESIIRNPVYLPIR